LKTIGSVVVSSLGAGACGSVLRGLGRERLEEAEETLKLRGLLSSSFVLLSLALGLSTNGEGFQGLGGHTE
jgi:hypothetical protein